MSTEIEVRTDAEGDGRYALLVDGEEAGEMDFRTVEGRRVVTHTGVRDRFEGQGLAGQLARRVITDARAEGFLLVPLCPYLASYLDKHPEHQDLIDQDLYTRLQR